MTNKFMPPTTQRKEPDPPTKVDVIGAFIAALIVIPLMMVLFYNYGATEVIESLGGPDNNLNVIDGYVAVLFLAGLGSLVRRGLAGT
jgi:hypothetical protein